MKTIENKQTQIPEFKIRPTDNKEKLMTYADLMNHVMDIVPQTGFTPEDITKRVRIKLAMGVGKPAEIKLEDQDFENFCKMVKDSRWVFWSEELNEFFEVFKK